MTKPKLVAEILKETKSEGSKHFDAISDKSTKYLTKLLKVINSL